MFGLLEPETVPAMGSGSGRPEFESWLIPCSGKMEIVDPRSRSCCVGLKGNCASNVEHGVLHGTDPQRMLIPFFISPI